MFESDQYIRSVELKRGEVDTFDRYPFCLPVIKSLHSIELHPKVTFFVGENGSGKSTILEAIAAAYGFNPEGGTINFNFSSRDTHSELKDYVRLVKGSVKPRDGFFLRAESFYNTASYIDDIDREAQGSGMPRLVDSYGGRSLHERSHGEAFMSLITNRFGGRGLYILDEPEAALSPSRQMAMISSINDLVKDHSQFIIATHSPIIMAYPDALIYEIKDAIRMTKYENTEHYQITKTFINDTQNMLNILMED